MNNWKHLKNYEFNDKQKQLIFGSMLGDGSLTALKWGNKQSCYAETHSLKQIKLLEWKKEILFPVGSTLRTIETNARKNVDGKLIDDNSRKLHSCILQTMHHQYFTSLEKNWYLRDSFGNYILNNNKRRIKMLPTNFSLNNFIIAVWYFDDGSNNPATRQATFNTQGFTIDEVKILTQKLKKTGFNASLCFNRNKPIIQILSSSYLKFIEMVSEYLPHESLNYKIDLSKYKNPNYYPGAKLSENNIKEILKLSTEKSPTEIAKKFNVKNVCIYNILNGKTWKKITGGTKSKRIVSKKNDIGIRFRDNKWIPSVKILNHKFHLGSFSNKSDAIKILRIAKRMTLKGITEFKDYVLLREKFIP